MSILHFYEKYLEPHYTNPKQCVSLGYLLDIAMHMGKITKNCTNQQVLAYTECIHFGIERNFRYPPYGSTKNILHLSHTGIKDLITSPFENIIENEIVGVLFAPIFLGQTVIDTFFTINNARKIIKALKQDCKMKKIHGYNKYSKQIQNRTNYNLLNNYELLKQQDEKYDRINPPFSNPMDGFTNRSVPTLFIK